MNIRAFVADIKKRNEELVAVKPALRSVAVVFCYWLALGWATIFLNPLGFAFLPSTGWVAASTPYGLSAGLITAAILFGIILKRRNKMTGGRFAKASAFLLLPVLSFISGYHVPVVAVPMIHATVVGSAIELPYTVASGVHRGSKRCRSSIYLEDMPFMFDKLCDIPKSDMKGARIIVTGRGSPLGVWADSYFRVD